MKKQFLHYCLNNRFYQNEEQIKTLELLINFNKKNNSNNSFLNLFIKKKRKLGFYLYGGVGVGKTMILNFFFEHLNVPKKRMHFNEFMINFHDFIFKHKHKDNRIDYFVKNLKNKTKIIYFDEFQVTNIVDAMILGKLFKRIFEEKIKVIFSSNIKINDLYKDGLQREQFIPFIKILESNCYQKELSIEEDYRLSNNTNPKRFLTPINESTNFIFNKFFRKITKNKNKTIKLIEVKGRKIKIENFYQRVVRFNFNELCDRNLGSEDYLDIADVCDFIFIENLPNFNEDNSNQQHRFITLIDIIYEKKIPLMITSHINLDLINSSKSMKEPFKRTISRLYELTSMSYS